VEEGLMQTHGYPDRANHLKQHTDLKATVVKLQGEVAAGKAMITIEVMRFLKDWLSNHIMVTDKALGKFLSSKNVK
jgi:methyl-accepting chemotaxis protein/hemerythrin